MNFTLTPEAIALCLQLFGGHPIAGGCHDNPNGLSWYAITSEAVRRRTYDWTAGCQITLKGTVTQFCPPPVGKDCVLIATYSARWSADAGPEPPAAYPNGTIYLCREQPIS